MGDFKFLRLNKENALAFKPYICEQELIHVLRHDYIGIGLLDKESQACGALIGQLDRQALTITYLSADEMVFGGCGALLDAAKKLAAKMKLLQIRALLSFPLQRELIASYFSAGFYESQELGCVYFLPIDKVLQSEIITQHGSLGRGEIITYDMLTPSQRMEYKALVGKSIPTELSIEAAPGRRIDAATLLYIIDNKICALLACSELADGSPYIAALWSVGKEGSSGLMPMIVKALTVLCSLYPQDKRISVTGASEAGKRVIEHLIKGYEEQVEIQTTKLLIWATEEENTMNILDMSVPNEAFIMPKLTALQNRFEEIGLHCDLVMKADSMPFLRTETVAEDITVLMTYYPVDEESAMEYVLEVSGALQANGDYLDASSACSSLNSSAMGPVAYATSDGNYVLLRYVVPEFGNTMEAPLLEMIIRIYKDALSTLRELLSGFEAQN